MGQALKIEKSTFFDMAPPASLRARHAASARRQDRWEASVGEFDEDEDYDGKLPVPFRLLIIVGGALIGWAIPVLLAIRLI